MMFYCFNDMAKELRYLLVKLDNKLIQIILKSWF